MTTANTKKKDGIAFEVQTFTLCDGWINCWTVDEQPQIFDTEAEAQEALDEFFANIAADMESGERAPDEGYNHEELRIVEIRGAS